MESAAPSSFGRATVSPTHSTFEQVAARQREREAALTWQDRYLRSSTNTFSLPVKLVLSLPLLVLPALMIGFKLWTNPSLITLMVLSWSGMAWYLKSVWTGR